MKYINFAVALLIAIMAAVHMGTMVFYAEQGFSMGDEIVLYSRVQWGSLMFLLFVLGCVLVVIWAEGELYHQWDRVSWVVGNLFVLGFIYILMQEEGSIGWFMYKGIVGSIHNLGGG
jgi:hypothetical protein